MAFKVDASFAVAQTSTACEIKVERRATDSKSRPVAAAASAKRSKALLCGRGREHDKRQSRHYAFNRTEVSSDPAQSTAGTDRNWFVIPVMFARKNSAAVKPLDVLHPTTLSRQPQRLPTKPA